MPKVIQFDGNPAATSGGQFWPMNVDLGAFWWEAWLCPDGENGACYWISDGNGGSHAVLAGFAAASNGRWKPQGNIWNGSGSFPFSCDSAEGFADGEWGHYAVGWAGPPLTSRWFGVYLNGIPVFFGIWAGPRRTGSIPGSDGILFLGGSDHQNMRGRLAAVRACEGAFPGNEYTTTTPFRPERHFGQIANGPSGSARSDFCMDVPLSGLVDFSDGFDGSRHSIQLGTFSSQGYPPAHIVEDATAPFAENHDEAPLEYVPADSAAPTGAKIFDSFARANQTLAFQLLPTLGSTESGSLGAKAWNHGATGWMIFCQRAICPSVPNTVQAVAFVNNDSANMDVRVVGRRSSATAGFDSLPKVAFRVADASNYLWVDGSGGTSIVVKKTVAGVTSTLATFTGQGTTWSALKVTVDAANLISVFRSADYNPTANTGTWTSAGTVTDATHAAAVGAGLVGGSSEGIRRDGFFTVF